MKAWHSLTIEPLAISVNISVKQLNDERFVDKVIQILEETGLEAKYLEMEITENLAMQDEQMDALTGFANWALPYRSTISVRITPP